jgi:hypothetical protein
MPSNGKLRANGTTFVRSVLVSAVFIALGNMETKTMANTMANMEFWKRIAE